VKIRPPQIPMANAEKSENQEFDADKRRLTPIKTPTRLQVVLDPICVHLRSSAFIGVS
jgi:hypothetical protein